MVGGDDGPAVAQLADVALAGVDHRLDGEGHALGEPHALSGAAVMEDLRFLVEAPPDAVAAEFAHHAEAAAFGVALDGGADVPERDSGANHLDAAPHALVGGLAQSTRLHRGLAHVEHAAGVA